MSRRSFIWSEPPADTCRACGCTDADACVTEVGSCAWAEAGLCTACVTVAARILGAPAIRFLLGHCGAVAPGASTTRPGADRLTGEGVLDLRATLQRVLEACPAEPQTQTQAQEART